MKFSIFRNFAFVYLAFISLLEFYSSDHFFLVPCPCAFLAPALTLARRARARARVRAGARKAQWAAKDGRPGRIERTNAQKQIKAILKNFGSMRKCIYKQNF